MEEPAAEPAPAIETTPPGEDEAPAPSEATAAKPMEEPAAEPAPAIETAPAGEDEAPDPSEATAAKPVEEPAAETETAAKDDVTEATAELLKKPDDDISELVSGAGPATATEDELAGPSEETVREPTEDVAETNPDAESAAAAEDETVAAATPAFRGTEEAPAPRATITIRELLEGTIEIGEHDVFYVHAVTPSDYQGLWGIIQKGVTENFARGVRITNAGRTDTYRVAVPADADEVLEDNSSSPLGLMIHRKSRETIVYNRKLGRLTQDPDVTIFPGNELIIVGFKPEELISLYKHFSGADDG